MKCVISVLGKDRSGIVAAVATTLAECSANIDDISQTILGQGEIFSMTMLPLPGSLGVVCARCGGATGVFGAPKWCGIPERWPKAMRFTHGERRFSSLGHLRPGETRERLRWQCRDWRKSRCFWPNFRNPA